MSWIIYHGTKMKSTLTKLLHIIYQWMLWMTMRINYKWPLKIVDKEMIEQNENMQISITRFAC